MSNPHKVHEDSVAKAADAAGGGLASVIAALQQVINNTRELNKKQRAEQDEALDHLEKSLDSIVNGAYNSR